MKKFPFVSIFLTIFVLVFSSNIFASDKESEEEKFNPSQTIFHHVADSYEWEFFTIGDQHYSLPLPVILYSDKGLDVFLSSELHHAKEEVHHEKTEGESKEETHHGKTLKTSVNTYLVDHGKISLADGGTLYDFSITKNVFSMFLSVALLFIIFFSVARAYKKNQGKAPKGLQSFFEPIILFIRDDIARDAIGPKHERFLPYLLTVFFFIWFNNVLGLFPAGANLTGNIAVTMTLAFFTLLMTLLSSNKNYWNHIFNTPGVPWWLKTVVPIMPLVEFIGIFTKPFALMIRLFANITAGHIIMLSLFSLIFIFKKVGIYVAPASVAFAVAMMFLELFVAILQAYVFTLLSALYFGGAVEDHHHEHEEAHH
ncbi:MAG: F0F1 ATP synthase subunit A [Microscillaceae bacterium]|nr:F0F1 ATP synthase subunit A [Microscillaceae bacterium]